MTYNVGDTVTLDGIECVIVYKADTEQSWGRYILFETHDLHYYEPELGTGEVDKEYTGKPYGDSDTQINGTDGTSVGSGKSNTDSAIDQVGNNPDYFWYYVNQHRQKTGKQWIVPSNGDFAWIYLCYLAGYVDNIAEGYYWSSSNYYSYAETPCFASAVSLSPFDGPIPVNQDQNSNRVRLCLYATDADLNSKTIEITCDTEGADIRYTLDGNEPTSSSTLYTGAFTVAPPVTIKSKAFRTDMIDSDMATLDVAGGGYSG